MVTNGTFTNYNESFHAHEAGLQYGRNEAGYYSIIPSWVMRSTKVTPTAKLLFGSIASLSRAEGYCYATNKYLAENICLDERSVAKPLKELQDNGFIEITINKTKLGTERLIKCIEGGVRSTAYPGTRENVSRGTRENVVLDIYNITKDINNSAIQDSGVELKKKEKRESRCPNKEEGHKGCIEFLDSLGHKFTNYQKQIGHLHSILRAGYTFREINKAIDGIEKDKFYQERGWDMATVSNYISRVRKVGAYV